MEGMVHAGARLLRNAGRPSCPSGKRGAAMASAVISFTSAGDVRAREGSRLSIGDRFGSAAEGLAHIPLDRIVQPATAPPRVRGRWPSRARRRIASGEKQLSRGRSADLRSTNGEIIAGRIPSLVSVNPNTAASSATTIRTRQQGPHRRRAPRRGCVRSRWREWY